MAFIALPVEKDPVTGEEVIHKTEHPKRYAIYKHPVTGEVQKFEMIGDWDGPPDPVSTTTHTAPTIPIELHPVVHRLAFEEKLNPPQIAARLASEHKCEVSRYAVGRLVKTLIRLDASRMQVNSLLDSVRREGHAALEMRRHWEDEFDYVYETMMGKLGDANVLPEKYLRICSTVQRHMTICDRALNRSMRAEVQALQAQHATEVLRERQMSRKEPAPIDNKEPFFLSSPMQGALVSAPHASFFGGMDPGTQVSVSVDDKPIADVKTDAANGIWWVPDDKRPTLEMGRHTVSVTSPRGSIVHQFHVIAALTMLLLFFGYALPGCAKARIPDASPFASADVSRNALVRPRAACLTGFADLDRGHPLHVRGSRKRSPSHSFVTGNRPLPGTCVATASPPRGGTVRARHSAVARMRTTMGESAAAASSITMGRHTVTSS